MLLLHINFMKFSWLGKSQLVVCSFELILFKYFIVSKFLFVTLILFWQLAENWEAGVQSLVWEKSLTPGFALINNFYEMIISVRIDDLSLIITFSYFSLENQVTIRSESCKERRCRGLKPHPSYPAPDAMQCELS